MVFIRYGYSCTGQASKLSPEAKLQAVITTGLPGDLHHSAMDNTFYSRTGLTNLSALGTLPLSNTQTVTSTSSMATDIATIATVIPNVLLKLQQRIIRGKFIDLSELL